MNHHAETALYDDGPRAVVVDEAQELTDAEWQMLLLRRIDPESFGKGIEAAVDRYVTMT